MISCIYSAVNSYTARRLEKRIYYIYISHIEIVSTYKIVIFLIHH